MITFIVTILVFSLVILVHEYGHYKVAKSVGIKIEEFAIGMGPKLFKWERQGTIYTIRILPIGGYCKMEGEEEDVKSSTSYNCKTVWQRFKVIAAGPIMNYALAIVIFIIISFGYGVQGNMVDQILEESNLYSAGIRPGDRIVEINGNKAYIWDEIIYDLLEKNSDKLDEPLNIKIKRDKKIYEYNVMMDKKSMIGIYSSDQEANSNVVTISDKTYPAYIAGIRTGDKIISINNIETPTFIAISEAIKSSSSGILSINVMRDGKVETYNVTAVPSPQLMFNTTIEKSIMTTISSSIYKTGYYIRLMFEVIGKLITGNMKEGSVGGPVQIVSMIGETTKLGVYPLLNLVALLSINLGFFNLLPIPALDGSKLVFLIIEKIRGKKIPVEKEGIVHFIGFVCLITLMVFVTYKDIMRLF